jgi:hypothetical protein
MKERMPDALVVYLTRLPSHGRETAHGIRSLKAGRALPIVFVGGKGGALEKTKAKVPDGLFVQPEELGTVLEGLAKG